MIVLNDRVSSNDGEVQSLLYGLILEQCQAGPLITAHRECSCVMPRSQCVDGRRLWYSTAAFPGSCSRLAWVVSPANICIRESGISNGLLLDESLPQGRERSNSNWTGEVRSCTSNSIFILYRSRTGCMSRCALLRRSFQSSLRTKALITLRCHMLSNLLAADTQPSYLRHDHSGTTSITYVPEQL